MAASAAKEAPSSPSKEEKTPEASKAPGPLKEQPSPSSESKPELPKGDRIFASPIAKKIALERGIPLSQVKGTGPDGRIIREDVEKYKPELASPVSAPLPAADSSADYVDIPLSNMRRTIAARLVESKVQSPHYYLTVDIQMDKVLKLREVFNKSLAEKGAKLSINDFVVKAVAKALEDVPEVNSAWLGEVIRQ
jgi:pyruvate dehydrogenase E2 component (dihydrolipoamide acetyltransferase)